jgi:hypothetical protein
MAATTHITVDMLLAEQKRIRRYMLKHYPGMVQAHKITPYERDNRLAYNQKLIDLLQMAAENKSDPSKPKFLQLLNPLQ